MLVPSSPGPNNPSLDEVFDWLFYRKHQEAYIKKEKGPSSSSMFFEVGKSTFIIPLLLAATLHESQSDPSVTFNYSKQPHVLNKMTKENW